MDRTYGWVRDLPDPRDVAYSLGHDSSLQSSDLRSGCCPVYNQGHLSSCTAHAAAAAIRYVRKREGIPDILPSRLFIYLWTRMAMGTPDTDSGGRIRDSIKVLNTYGIPDENLWPYETDKFRESPPEEVYQSADKSHALQYESLNGLNQIRQSLTLGFPVNFGFTVFEEFEGDSVARDGMVPIPSANSRALGGHAVLAVGHSDKSGVVICQNSWGENWGDDGFFYLPYAYFNSNFVSDFWSIRMVL